MNAVLRIFVWLLALSVVALPVVAVVNGWVGAERWPLAKLRVHGEFKRVPAEQLQQVLLPYARAGFFAVKLQDAQDALEKLPWVESARVRKQWPDVLEVTLVEHKPFARWGNDRLVSEQGKLFPTPKKLADGVARTGRPGQPDRRSDEAVQRLACIVRTGRRRCAPGNDGCTRQLVAGAEQRHRSGGRP